MNARWASVVLLSPPNSRQLFSHRFEWSLHVITIIIARMVHVVGEMLMLAQVRLVGAEFGLRRSDVVTKQGCEETDVIIT